MTHPTESNLALYAGVDLSWFRQWQVERHVRRCSECQRTAAEYSELRTFRSEGPALNWAQLTSEMKANIRLGLAAGECVGAGPVPRSMVSGMRLVIAGSLLTILFGVGVWVNRPGVRSGLWQRSGSGTVLEASESGIQVRGVQQTLRIMHPAARNVVYTMGSQGELGARAIDPSTGNVAITRVYGE